MPIFYNPDRYIALEEWINEVLPSSQPGNYNQTALRRCLGVFALGILFWWSVFEIAWDVGGDICSLFWLRALNWWLWVIAMVISWDPKRERWTVREREE